MIHIFQSTTVCRYGEIEEMWKIELTTQLKAPRRFTICPARADAFKSAIRRYAADHCISELAVNARIIAEWVA